jgi:hypothetical protein
MADHGPRSMRAFLLILFCLIARPALALDSSVGELTTCSSWLQERDKLATFIHSHSGADIPRGTFVPGAWLIGFIEGYGWACPKEKPLAAGLDSDAVYERVDSICRTKSGDTPLLLAAMELVKQLDPQHSEVCVH